MKATAIAAIIATLIAALSIADNGNLCAGKAPGYYCLNDNDLMWCYGGDAGSRMQCQAGLTCKCGYSQSFPCAWSWQTLDCQGKPGDILGGGQQSSEAPPTPPTPPPTSESEVIRPPGCPPCNCSEGGPSPSEEGSTHPPQVSSEVSPPPTGAKCHGQKVVGYFTNWAQYRWGSANGRACKYFPRDVPANLLTHVNYAFAVFERDFKLKMFEWNDDVLYPEMMKKKSENPNLKVLISVGGWNFNFFDSTKHLFGEMASTAANRKIFIDDAIKFARQHGFDGIDLDWEYPANKDQGGQDRDTPNFTYLLKEFRAAIDAENTMGKSKLLLTIAAPAGYWNIDLLEVEKFHQYLDWINVMTYDLHGSWDNKVGAHTALYSDDNLSVDHCIKEYLRRGVPAHKLILGMSFYGKTFILQNANNAALNAPTIGAGRMGSCTGQDGVYSYDEIQDFIKDGATTRYDEPTHTMFAHKGTQLVSYDNIDTHNEKLKYIRDKCLGGSMVWALDLDLTNGLLTNINNKLKE